ncbi:hypothetical protein GCM10027614_81420 [Micromonospora vulcania]
MAISRRQMLMGAMVAAVAGGLADFARPALADGGGADDESARLWYSAPASRWLEALPIGNGRLGAMVFGGVDQELLQLNEETITAGGPHNPVNPRRGTRCPRCGN